MGEAARVAAFGLVLGAAAAVGSARLIQSLLFDTSPWDVPTLAGAAIVLAGASLLASYVPARRAAAVNPIDALRME